ncbi:MAG TPA: S1 RNA-binding domain-containing protein [Bacillota bacterium]|nr:S1 RNA-binding domain-containing protein [Bacillota bacterium]HPJ23924.1 S1 RNA-binding domain-containing protein [Bacillota bacterium]
MKVGDIVKGRITSIKPYGAFVKVDDDFDGLVHISEISDGYVRNIEDYLSVGDVVSLQILSISDDQKLSLSYKTQNKSGRKKREIIKLTHGFKPLADKLEEWVNNYTHKR